MRTYMHASRCAALCGPTRAHRWSKVVEASTKIDPVDGGGRGPDDKFTWTQSATDVTIMFKVGAALHARM